MKVPLNPEPIAALFEQIAETCDIHQCATREDWLKARAQWLGASESAILLDQSRFKGKLALHYQKLGFEDHEDDPEYLQIGSDLESAVAKMYARNTDNRRIFNLGSNTILVSKQYPWLSCTLDRITEKPEWGYGVLELKTRGSFAMEDWEQEVPEDVMIQVQHQLLVTGLPWGSVGALIGGPTWHFRWTDVAPNLAIHSAILDISEKFMANVKSGIEPQADDHPSTKDILKQLYPLDNGESVEASSEVDDLDIELVRVKDELKALESRKDAAENRLRQIIGPNTFIQGQDYKYSYKTQENKVVVKVQPDFEQDLIDAKIPYDCSGGTTYRVLRRSAVKGK